MVAVRVGSPRITQKVDIGGIRVQVDTVLSPPPAQIVYDEICGLSTVTNRNVSPVGLQVIDAMGNNLAFR